MILKNNYIEIKIISKNKTDIELMFLQNDFQMAQCEIAVVINKDVDVKIINKDDLVLFYTFGMIRAANEKLFIKPENLIGLIDAGEEIKTYNLLPEQIKELAEKIKRKNQNEENEKNNEDE